MPANLNLNPKKPEPKAMQTENLNMPRCSMLFHLTMSPGQEELATRKQAGELLAVGWRNLNQMLQGRLRVAVR